MGKNIYKFVEYSKGVFAADNGKTYEYDNIILSDGLMSAKFKNETGKEYENLEQGVKVRANFAIEIKRGENISAVITAMESLDTPAK